MKSANVFTVNHLQFSSDGTYECWKLIGVYSTCQAAEDAITRYRRVPGFVEPEASFEVVTYEDNYKEIRVYATKEAAEAASPRIDYPCFTETVHTFEINTGALDKNHWTEGYISCREAMDGY